MKKIPHIINFRTVLHFCHHCKTRTKVVHKKESYDLKVLQNQKISPGYNIKESGVLNIKRPYDL